MIPGKASSFAFWSILATVPAVAEEVILDYEATAQTVVGTPFGLEVPRLTRVTGVFVYNPNTSSDSNPSPQRGNYQLASGGAFEARFLNLFVLGSATPYLQVEDIQVGSGSIDTFRFNDGDDNTSTGGTMSRNGRPNGRIRLALSITDGSGAAFRNDSLPAIFPMAVPLDGFSLPHTFSLQDDDGRLLLQFERLVQRQAPFLKIMEVEVTDRAASILFHSHPGKTYTLEFSTDHENWIPIESGHPSDGYTTRLVDAEIVSRLGAFPAQAFYRVAEEE